MNTSAVSPTAYLTRARPWARALAGAIVFLVAYLAVSFLAAPLADRDLPLPDASAADTAAFYTANPLSALVGAALQVFSVLGFAVFMFGLTAGMRSYVAPVAARLRLAGMVSVAAMVVSSAITTVMVVIAPSDGSVDAVGLLRQGGFLAGGVANVATLGAFVFGSTLVLGRAGVLGKPTRWFGYVAGTLAMLSVLSLALYYANGFLPVGRVLSMVWCILAACVLLRRRTTAG